MGAELGQKPEITVTPAMLKAGSYTLREWLGLGRSDMWTTEPSIEQILKEILAAVLSSQAKISFPRE